MKLLDDIIEIASDNKEPIGNLLRKCLVLESQLKNKKFKSWLNKEIDGYDRDDVDNFPDYRVFNCVNKGNFYGMTVQMTGQPISLHVMSEADRKLVEKVYLHQPAASYEARPGQDTDAILPWNQYLVAKYQTKIYRNGEPALMRAWQEIPGSVLVALLEQVRTRVLRFSLELKENLPANSPDAAQLPAAVVDHSVVNNIFGGNILIASHAEHISQISHINITEGDTAALESALANLGITPEGVAALRADLAADKSNGQATIGSKTKNWLKDIGKYLGKEGAKASLEIAKQAATKWVLQHYGLLPPS